MFQLLTLFMPLIKDVLGRVIPDPEKRAEAELELQTALMQNEKSIMDAMSKVMTADANSSPYVRNARPTIVYWSLGITTYIVLGAPFGYADEMVEALAAMPSELYQMMMVGIGAFGVTRGLEKTARAYKPNKE